MTVTPAAPLPGQRHWLQRHWGLFVVLAAILLIGSVRFRLRDCALERDEGEYAYAGQMMLQGIPPYALAYNMKFPGTYAAYALIMAVFGQTPAGIHLGVLGMTSLMALMIYWLGRKLADEWIGTAAGTFSVFLSASPAMLGLAGHATHFAALFATAGLCLVWPADQRNRPLTALAGGILFGLAILMKQHAAPLALWGLAVLVFSSGSKNKGWGWQRLRVPAIYSLGVFLPFLVTCLILWWAGVFGRFWFWTITYASAYVTMVPLKAMPELFWFGFSEVFKSGWQMWSLAAIGLVTLWFAKPKSGVRFELAGLFLASFLTTVPGFLFRFHYFLLMVPVLALLAAGALGSLRLLPKVTKSIANPLLLGICILAVAWNAYGNRDIWFQNSTSVVSRLLYSANPFLEAEAVAGYIRTNSIPTDQVAVLGSEPEIFFLSHRRSATSYIYTYPLMEPQPFSHRMQLEMISQIEHARPKFIVVATANFSWLQQPDSDDTITRWWPNMYEDKYQLVGVAEVVSITESRSVWGRSAASYQPVGDSLLETYQRKDTLPPAPAK